MASCPSGSRREQADLACASHCVAAARGRELAINRTNMRLNGVARDVELVRDLGEREMRRQELQYSKLGGGERLVARLARSRNGLATNPAPVQGPVGGCVA